MEEEDKVTYAEVQEVLQAIRKVSQIVKTHNEAIAIQTDIIRKYGRAIGELRADMVRVNDQAQIGSGLLGILYRLIVKPKKPEGKG